MTAAPMIGWEWYDGFTHEGTSCDERWLRLGRNRWRMEVGRRGVVLRLGGWEFSAGAERAED